ncbi:PfkB family carbohydrate kinase [Pseudomonas syringae]|uniref:PfkB family carbohydrate kinase n=1 Tax=Pseudomonas syringae TaxID=317 RepID=UPI00200B04AF|nr:PfkB family carbohydrate kinase [Pseudomonas syringae]MCK9742191.1 PfkB family carbohydrate kinase [Pseudomonas syringae pv. syringae]MCK9767796.1 PfkB family carbohydrate kinase [Pseudomonas syringae pv. syringae]MDU8618389.1 PfkB family carbohydrate kinase [Pseudomonas syringae]
MPAKLLYTGQVVVDLVMAIDRLPPSGGDVLASSATFEAGGGFNVMAAACRNGLPTVYLGRHGQGRFGDLARQAMRDEGVEIATMPVPGEDTGLAVALVEASAERSFISYVGAEGGLSAADLQGVQVSAEDYVVVSGYSLAHKNKVTALLAWLDGLPGGTTVVFDPGPLVDALHGVEMRAVLPLISVWSSNCEEALRFTQTRTPADALHHLASILREDALIVIRDGPAGCWVHHAGQTRHIPGFAVTAIDTNGAGDAHAGVLLAELARGSSVDRAALRANAAAAIAVTRRGPATAPGREEVDALVGADF